MYFMLEYLKTGEIKRYEDKISKAQWYLYPETLLSFQQIFITILLEWFIFYDSVTTSS